MNLKLKVSEQTQCYLFIPNAKLLCNTELLWGKYKVDEIKEGCVHKNLKKKT